MTERKKAVALISLVCAVCLLASTLGCFMTHGDITYRLWSRIRPYAEPALEITSLSATQSTTADELILRENVRASSLLMLVNRSHPLPLGYEALIEEYNGAKMHPDMIPAYIALRDELVRRTGIRVYVSSDFRTPEEQAEILAESGGDVAAEVGCSEHEAGLALDIYAPYFGGESLLQTRVGRLMNEICADYGFIIRYPLGKEAITGIDYEPWHLRYVGAPHARIITDAGLTLEEYVGLLTPNVWYRCDGYLISRQLPTVLTLPAAFSACSLSPDNTGHVILTVKA